MYKTKLISFAGEPLRPEVIISKHGSLELDRRVEYVEPFWLNTWWKETVGLNIVNFTETQLRIADGDEGLAAELVRKYLF